MSGSLRLVAAALAVLALPACAAKKPRTEVLVIFEADLAVRRVAREIQITAWGGARGTATPSENAQELRLDIDSIGGWPISHALVPDGGDASRLFRVEGRVFDIEDRTNAIGTVRAISGYVEGKTLILRLRFYGACLYQPACAEEDASCGSNGTCRPARPSPRELPELAPNDGGVPMPEGCTTAIDCDDAVTCTVDSCFEGACYNVPDDARCTAGTGTCDPALGCQYGACDATTCQPASCERSAACFDGSCRREQSCRLGEACCNDVCGGCVDSNPCTLDVCSDDLAMCGQMPAPAGTSCDDGQFCNGSETCSATGECTSAGNPCSSGTTCDEAMDSCVGCTSDAGCPEMVQIDTGTCMAVPSMPCAYAGQRSDTFVSYVCDAGTCRAGAPFTRTATCTRTMVDGSVCGTMGSTTWGTCMPTAGTCGTAGTRMGTVTSTSCLGGSCSRVSTTMTSESCAYMPPAWCSALEGGVDSGMDASMDASTDSGLEAGTDSGRDAASDSGSCLPSEASSARCHNLVDDDCDLLTDCDDPDCRPYCPDASAGMDGSAGSDGGPVALSDAGGV